MKEVQNFQKLRKYDNFGYFLPFLGPKIIKMEANLSKYIHFSLSNSLLFIKFRSWHLKKPTHINICNETVDKCLSRRDRPQDSTD